MEKASAVRGRGPRGGSLGGYAERGGGAAAASGHKSSLKRKWRRRQSPIPVDDDLALVRHGAISPQSSTKAPTNSRHSSQRAPPRPRPLSNQVSLVGQLANSFKKKKKKKKKKRPHTVSLIDSDLLIRG